LEISILFKSYEVFNTATATIKISLGGELTGRFYGGKQKNCCLSQKKNLRRADRKRLVTTQHCLQKLTGKLITLGLVLKLNFLPK